MHGALRAEPSRKVLPFGSVVQHPEDAAKNLSLVLGERKREITDS
jgi:hypothetical protein